MALGRAVDGPIAGFLDLGRSVPPAEAERE
jgi:hypothetical protein